MKLRKQLKLTGLYASATDGAYDARDINVSLDEMEALIKAYALEMVGEDENEDYDPRDEDPVGMIRNRFRKELRQYIKESH